MTRRTVPGIADLELGQDGILSVTHHAGVRLDATSARAVFNIHADLAAGRKTPVLVDICGVRSMDLAAREIASGPGVAAITSRLAIVAGNPVSAMLGNFFLRVSRPNYLTRMFSSDAEARAWLLDGAAGGDTP